MFENNVYNEMEILQWISERNQHIPIADLAFMINIPEDSGFAADDHEAINIETFDYN